MEKISFMRRLSSSLIDKVLILVLFIISALCISPYGMPSHLGSYYALLDAAPLIPRSARPTYCFLNRSSLPYGYFISVSSSLHTFS